MAENQERVRKNKRNKAILTKIDEMENPDGTFNLKITRVVFDCSSEEEAIAHAKELWGKKKGEVNAK